jgi:flagellin
MSLYVNTNTRAINANRQLFNSSLALDKSFERLSSGFRINSASDDAAGLQISDRLTTQVNGLNQGVRNANDGISVVQTAEGALNEITTALQRMRVLAVQAENGINSVADKLALQKELAQLKNEIDRIASSTEFAGSSLLDGSYSSSFLVGANSNQNIDVDLTIDNGFGSVGLSIDGLDITRSQSAKTLNIPINGGTPFTSADDLSWTGNIGLVENLLVSRDGINFFQIPSFTVDGVSLVDVFRFAGAIGQSGVFEPYSSTSTGFMTPSSATTLSLNPAQSALVPYLTFATSPDADKTLISNLTGLTLAQLGPENSISLDSNLNIIDRAIAFVGDTRSYLGATQNRFQSTIRNLSNISENVSAARSQIRDTDYALETANLTRNEIVQQASISVLAQANTQPQITLQLLR